ncbi:MAG: hypothetical protein R2854_11960 [Caldilineaceae bacterium]
MDIDAVRAGAVPDLPGQNRRRRRLPWARTHGTQGDGEIAGHTCDVSAR